MYFLPIFVLGLGTLAASRQDDLNEETTPYRKSVLIPSFARHTLN